MKSAPFILNILLIEDNPADSFLIEQMLLSSSLQVNQVFIAEKLSDGIALLKQHTISLVFIDLSLPDSFGMDTFMQLKDLVQNIPVIVLTGLSDSEMASETLKEGAQDYLVKGEFDQSSLVKSMQYSIERKKAEEKVLESEEKYKQIFYKNPFPMWIYDQQSLEIIEVNDACLLSYGYTKQEFLKLSIHDIQHPDTEVLLASLNDNRHENMWVHRKKSGEAMIVEFARYPINYYGKTAIQVQINDVTKRVMLEKELSLKKQQIIEAVLNAQERERKIIGEELHDNINQILTAVKLRLGFILETNADSTELIAKCANNVTLAIEEVRKLSKALILPSNLKELGLVSSLDILVKDLKTITSLDICIQAEEFNEQLLAEDQKVAIYRIIQEQLNNVLKYADASNVKIYLSSSEDNVNLSISDDGKGFDTKVKRNGIGLYNIVSRAELFQGNVEIDSSPGNGCTLSVQLKSKKRSSYESVRHFSKS